MKKRKTKILSIVGARPQFIKLAVLSKEIRQHFDEVIVHTGQHYDYEMSKIFFKNLDIPEPDYNLNVGSAERENQIRLMTEKLENVLLKEKPNLVTVFGDTNTTLAGAQAASKLKIRLAHVESGMRSFDIDMPEEINRIATDKVSDILFCSTKTAVENLKKENIKGKIFLVGDVMIDAIKTSIEAAGKKSEILETLSLQKKQYMVATVHRAGNTNSRENLNSITQAFIDSNDKIIFPLHPRTLKSLKSYKLYKKFENTNVSLIKPLSYLDMLVLEKHSKKILTDSGGMQKEAYFFGVPCITLRNSTEWTETVDDGWNIVVGADKLKILKAISNFTPQGSQTERYGNGAASKNIVQIINSLN